MALNMPNSRQNTNTATNKAPRANWETDAYLNIYVSKRSGDPAKLGALKLSLNRRNDAQVIEHLQNAPDLEEALKQLAGRITMTFVVPGAEPEEEDMLDLW